MSKLSLSLLICSMFSLNSFATDMASIPTPSKVKKNNSSDKKTSSKKSESNLYVVSNKHVNRIITPFKSPSIVIDSIPNLSYKQRGSVLYLALPSSLEETVAGWITEKNDESSAIRVMFKPMPVQPKEVQLGQSIQGSAVARKFERTYNRNDVIRKSMEALSLNKLPVGYQMSDVNGSYIPNCSQEGLIFDFYRGQFASGGDYVISIGTVENTSSHTVLLKENNCYSDGVVGVAAYPEIELLPTEKSEIYVMFYRQKNIKTTAENPRKSLLEGQ